MPCRSIMDRQGVLSSRDPSLIQGQHIECDPGAEGRAIVFLIDEVVPRFECERRVTQRQRDESFLQRISAMVYEEAYIERYRQLKFPGRAIVPPGVISDTRRSLSQIRLRCHL